jgi:hypothetical protein
LATAAPQPRQVTPAEIALQTGLGYMASICLHVATELRIADLLADGPLPVSELARRASVHEDALYRVLRLLASIGIFQETSPRTFALTPPADVLREASPNSIRDMVLWISDPFHFKVYADLMHSVVTGQTAADRVLGMPVFDYFREDRQEGETFNRAMTTFSTAVIPAALEVYDFSGTSVLVDVAGGHGQVIFAILQKYPQVRGILSDLDHVLEGARPRLRQFGLDGRCELRPCDFFKAVPEGGDVYLMKHIIHDWDDERALLILRNIHRAMGAKNGKVVLFESVLAAGNEPHLAKFIDIEMLALPGGRERNADEFRDLFARAGFRLTRILPTKSLMCVIEAERV